MPVNDDIQVITIGASAGGMQAIQTLLQALPAHWSIPILICQHLHPRQGNFMIQNHNAHCQAPVKEAEDKEILQPGVIYFAPPDYHLLVERDRSLSLSVDGKVNFSRPSIDILFESAAWTFGRHLTGVLLTGGNSDGAAGMKTIAECGGCTIVQDPKTCLSPAMPMSAIRMGVAQRIMTLEQIRDHILNLGGMPPPGEASVRQGH